MTKPVNHRKLNANQLLILKFICKFRFISPGLFAELRGVSTWSVQNSLNILMGYGLIARRYDKSYKLLGKPASYHLTPKSMKILREELELDKRALHARYKDKSVEEAFIDHSLDVFRQYLRIRDKSPKTYDIFSKYELYDQEYFIDPLPDLHLERMEPAEDMPDTLWVDVIPRNTPAWIIKKRIDQYLDHYEEGEWEDEYPAIVLYVDKAKLVGQLHKYIQRQMDDLFLDDDEIDFAVILRPIRLLV